MPTESDVDQIVERIASAPFEPRQATVPPDWRGLFYLGHELRAREPSLMLHVFTRVVVERQWAFGTNAESYLADVRSAVRSPYARIAAYRRRGGAIVAVVASTEAVVEAARRGAKTLSLFVVAYSADRGIIVTGYQASDLTTVSVPEEVQWLK